MERQSQEMNLIKRSNTYKIIIPAKVERIIRFLCERVWNTEWSGILFYTPTGQFEDGSLQIHCVDILPMDIGSTTYTEFDMSPDVISYMAENPELLDCKMGLIHSHNNMQSFFSGTDLNTLKDEGKDRNHFVSLIVNNAGTYTAAITRKIKYKSVRDLSYEGFNGTVDIPEKEIVEGEELEYFYLDIIKEEEPENPFYTIDSRLNEIKDSKKKAPAKVVTPQFTYPNTYSNTANTKNTLPSYYNRYYKEPTLFDDLEWEDTKPVSTPSTPTKVEDVQHQKLTDAAIEEVVNQLLTGSVTVTKMDAETKKKVVDSISKRFDKRFGKGDLGMQLFNFWATDFIEFLIWYTVTDPEEDEYDVAATLASKVIESLKKLPKNEYIDEYIDILDGYVTRLQ